MYLNFFGGLRPLDPFYRTLGVLLIISLLLIVGLWLHEWTRRKK